MMNLRYTLLSDGGSDRALMPIIEWSVSNHNLVSSLQPQWADLGILRRPPTMLQARIAEAVRLYPCDILFIHRDSEKDAFDVREQEIQRALLPATRHASYIAVPIVPVRMTEAWLMFSEPAIRRAAGNPSGSQPLSLPKLRDVERHPSPKALLFEQLKIASGRAGRRLADFDVERARTNLAQHIEDFRPLRRLSSYLRFEEHLIRALNTLSATAGALKQVEPG